MADAGFKLTVEGEREFRKAISDINAILRLNQAELQKVTAEYNAGEKSIDSMKAKQTELGGVIERQTAVVAQMEGELSRLTDTYGENDKGTIKMRTELDKASASLASMQAQFRANAEEIEKAAKATENYDTTIADADAQIKAFAAELRAMETDVTDGGESLSLFGKNSEETKKQIKSLTDQNDLLEKSVEQHRKKLDLLNEEMEEAVKLYGSQSREVASYRTEIATTQAEVNGLTQKIDANNDMIEKAETRATGLSDVFSGISDITGVQIPSGLTEMLGGVGLVEGAVSGGLVAAFGAAATKVIEIKKELIASATELTKMSWDTGLDTETLQALQGIARYFNVDVDTLKDSMKDLRNRMAETAEGNEDLAKTFGELGVDILDSNGQLRSVMAVYLDLSDAFSKIESKEERLAKMEELLGESANQSAQIAAAGKTELMRVMNLYYDNYMVRSDETIAQLEAEGKTWEELKTKVQGVWNVFVEMNREAAKDDWLTKIGSKITGWGYIARLFANLDDALGNFATTPRYATGTYNHPGGYALVGERGPEIVDLPAGSRVYPSGEYPAGGSVNYYNVSINASDVKEFNDIVRLAQAKRVTERMK